MGETSNAQKKGPNDPVVIMILFVAGSGEELVHDQAGEGVLGLAFGMPLDGQAEGVVEQFEGFDDAVVGDRGGGEFSADFDGALEVGTVDGDCVLAGPLLKVGFVLDVDRVGSAITGAAVIDGVGGVEFGEVLKECAAVGDVDHLEAEADTEDGQFLLAGVFVEEEFESLAARMDQAGGLVLGFIPEGGVEVESAGEDQAVQLA